MGRFRSNFEGCILKIIARRAFPFVCVKSGCPFVRPFVRPDFVGRIWNYVFRGNDRFGTILEAENPYTYGKHHFHNRTRGAKLCASNTVLQVVVFPKTASEMIQKVEFPLET